MKYTVKTNIAEVLSEIEFAKENIKAQITEGFTEGFIRSLKAIIDKTPRRKAVMISGPEAGWEGALQGTIAGPFAQDLGVSFTGSAEHSLTKILQLGPEAWVGDIGVSGDHPYAYYVEYGNAGSGPEIFPKRAKVLHWEDQERGEVFAHKVKAFPPFGMFTNSLPQIQTIMPESLEKALARALEK